MSLLKSWFGMETTKETKENAPIHVLNWLTNIKLATYYRNFVDNGYDCMESIKSIDQDALKKIEIELHEHQLVILREIKKLNDFELLTNILECNDLTELSYVLNQNDIDLGTLQNDLKPNEAKSFCAALQFDQQQTKQFLKLMYIIHSSTNNNNSEQKQNESSLNKCKHINTAESKAEHMKMRIVLIGDSSVGKTSLIQRYAKDVFNKSCSSTIGIDFALHEEILSDDTIMKMQIWDTAGQETYSSVGRCYYQSADAIIVCFDIGRNITFENCANWSEQIEEYGQNDVVVIFVGCKGDTIETGRKNVEIKAAQIMQRFGKLYCECSAKTGENVRNVFLTAAELVMKQRKQKRERDYKHSKGDNHAKRISLSLSRQKTSVKYGCMCYST